MNRRVTFGKISWDTPSPVGGGGDDFLRLSKDGQYVVRFISEAPLEYAAHWTEDTNGQMRRVKCAGRDCVLCKEGVKPQVRYLIEVIDMDSGLPKVVEFGAQVFNQVRALYNNKHWGEPRGYNLMIDRDKNRGPSGMYQVMPLGKEELDADIKAAALEFKDRIKEVIAKFADPSSNEEILQKLGRVETPEENSSWGSSETTETESVKTDEASGSSDDEDFDF